MRETPLTTALTTLAAAPVAILLAVLLASTPLQAQLPSSGATGQLAMSARARAGHRAASPAVSLPGSPPASAPLLGRPSQPGNPLPGITADEFELFRIGLDDFVEVENAGDGLGPAFNGLGCSQCHSTPAIGGISPVATVRAGYRDPEGRFFVLGGGTLYQLFSLPNHECQPTIPPEANVIARRIPIPLFGAGLVEAIPDETLLALADPDDEDGDGISGRAAIITDVATGQPRVGRFGWKAQHATLLTFGADAYRNEMGITSDLFRNEVAPGIDPETLKLCDLIPDPEDSRDPVTGLRGIDAFEAFMKVLAPIERLSPGDPAFAQDAVRGETIFAAVGCTSCHIPILMTGPDTNPVFDRRPVALYSDLLLHDVATGDGIPQAAALANEIRTPALWGLRFRRPFLHDGSAATPLEAILRHGNEAQTATTNYRELPTPDQDALLAFLDSL